MDNPVDIETVINGDIHEHNTVPVAHPINNEENKDEIIPDTATCRICRGESTPDNPLFHPCRCKGSIKYLHEPCLLEWINARHIDINKPGTSVECDICHYPFQFKTTYDDDMPEKIPLSLVIVNFFYDMLSGLHFLATSLAFVILIGFGFPLMWNFFGKFYTFIMDGKMPYERNLTKSMIFGYEENVPDDYTYTAAFTALLYNHIFSTWQIVFTVILHLAIYFQYDMIVREDIFNKMIFHKIGPNLSIDALKARLRERFPMIDNETLEHVARIVSQREIRENEMRNLQNVEDEDANIIPDEQIEHLEENIDDESDADFVPSENETQSDSDLSIDDTVINEDEQMRQEVERGVEADNFQLEHPIDDMVNLQAQRQFDDILDRHRNLRAQNIPAAQPENLEAAEGIPDRPVLPQDDPVINPFANADFGVPDNENEEGRQLGPLWINLQIKLSNIFIYYGLCVVFVFLYLLIAYALPTSVGSILMRLYYVIFLLAYSSVWYSIHYCKLNQGYEALLKNIPGLAYGIDFISETLVQPLLNFVSAYYSATSKNSTYVRAIPSAVTFLTAITIICVSSDVLGKGYSRYHSMNDKNRRFAFQLLFALKCTFKVFIIFFIELAGFPILAGAMLDFSLIAPILGNTGDLLFFPSISYFNFQTFCVYWLVGTLYMYWFAQYIGMIRKDIIRPGVLFFIRSPDDPNTKILHDSLIHPMGAQLSRLFLSMFIYAVFIILGFGFHTRVLFPIILKSQILETPEGFLNGYVFNLATLLIIFYFSKRIIEANPNVNVLVKNYWAKIFEVSSRKLRLSSFILGTDYASERGHIIYRNIFYKLFSSRKAQWSNPDLYSSPKTHSEAMKLFKEDQSIHAYFVPDGLLMRVPSSDIVSRNYVQTMFVPVTKSDKLLKPLDLKRLKERNLKNAGEFGYLDQQNTDFDEYFICYVPPNFTARYTCLMILMWFFASVLIISTAISAQYIFNTLTVVFVLLPLKLFGFYSSYLSLMKIVLVCYRQINVQYVCLGAVIMSFMLDYYKKHHLSKLFFERMNAEEIPNEMQENQENEQENVVGQDIGVRPELEELVLNNFISKFVIGPVLVCVYGVIDYMVFGFVGNLVLRICIAYVIFLVTGKPMDVARTHHDIDSKLYFCVNSLFLRSIIVRCIKIVSGIRRNRNRRFITACKEQWLNIIKPYFTFVLRCYVIFFSIVLLTTVLDYTMDTVKYSSFMDALKFISIGRLRYENANVPWTFAEHLTFILVIAFVSSYMLSELYASVNKRFLVFTQNVKDEVYAKGRSLENYGADTAQENA
ncbi:similar to Saccharomyces cerevisiae YIL030C SSM4 Ubiquitin-protein ligase involved in ER-associated protein degradation [Maudiozyma saulgeensis]|uniref:RING-type E3 ubiquitin transferase n=1 Tax=Maudiozyma saulgeensis TaxID=1789683 RepID=A0A1X7R6Q7_9SACH|nr:similar to Saccharomyces cerevisiae YIL030C SSM4 Ubiquitin-protein ligase involved in ER-associated protein degradation [Kazachstania saulgeensis]